MASFDASRSANEKLTDNSTFDPQCDSTSDSSHVYIHSEEKVYCITFEGSEKLPYNVLKSKVANVSAIPSDNFTLHCNGKPMYSGLMLPLKSDLHLSLNISGKGGGKKKDFHPEKEECGPCGYCKQKSRFSKYRHILSYAEETQMWLLEKFDYLKKTDCICGACFQVLKRKYRNEDYSPERTRKKQRGMCFLERFGKCDSVAAHTRQRIDSDVFVSMFSLQSTDFQDLNEDQGVELCRQHYNQYDKYTKPQCEVCESRKFRIRRCVYHCPDVEKVNYYYEKAGESTRVTPSSILCYDCYQHHRSIISKSDVVSDVDLIRIRNEHTAITDRPIREVQQVKEYAVSKAMIFVLSEMLERKPVLLSEVGKMYKEAVQEALGIFHQDSAYIVEESYFHKDNRAILTKVMRHLGKYVDHYTEKDQKYLGTVLIRTGSNLSTVILKLMYAKTKDEEMANQRIEGLKNLIEMINEK
ncbi:uncharacterized protein LOC144441166 [Glandiceps talaboti]